MPSRISGPRQMSTSAASYPSSSERNRAGSTQVKSSSQGDLTVTALVHDPAVLSMSLAAWFDQISGGNHTVSRDPSHSARLTEATTSLIANQSPSLALPCQDWGRVDYCHQGTMGPFFSGEVGPCLQPYGSMISYPGGTGSASQTYINSPPEMIMVLKEIQPAFHQPPAYVPGVYYSVSALPMPASSYQVMDSLGTQTFPGLQASSQPVVLTETPETPTPGSSRSNVLLRDPPPELGDISIVAPVQSDLALPPAPTQEQTLENWDELYIGFSASLHPELNPIANQDPMLCPYEIPDIQELLGDLEPLSGEQLLMSEDPGEGQSNRCLQDPGPLESGVETGGSIGDILTLVKDTDLPQTLDSLEDLDQPTDLQARSPNEAIPVEQGPERSSGLKCRSGQRRKSRYRATEPLEGEPKAKSQPPNAECPECPLGGDSLVGRALASDRPPGHMHKPESQTQSGRTRSPGQDKIRRAREKRKRRDQSKQPGQRVKAEEMSSVPKMKRKKSRRELMAEAFPKARSSLGMRMLESVQVLHALGKKVETKPQASSSRVLGNITAKPQDVQPSSAIGTWQRATQVGQVPEQSQWKAQKPGSRGRESPSPSPSELPPAGKVKLVPLPFLTLEKPPARRAPRRPQSLASRWPAAADPARPASTISAQPPAANSSQPGTTSCSRPARPARPISTNPSQAHAVILPSWPVPQSHSASSAPALARKTSSTPLQQQPRPSAGTKRRPPPKPRSPILLQDFSLQPIPWRKPNVPGPVVSTPIAKEQRGEREAMKKKAQQERERAASYTSWGKLQFFVEREREMEISRYHGYVK